MATSTSKILVEGPLSKWTNVVSGWQYRWFVLDQGTGLLSYYTVSKYTSYFVKQACCIVQPDMKLASVYREKERDLMVNADSKITIALCSK